MPWFRLLTAWPPTFKGGFPPHLKFKLLLQNPNNHHKICFKLTRNGLWVYIRSFIAIAPPFFVISTFLFDILYLAARVTPMWTVFPPNLKFKLLLQNLNIKFV